MASVPLHALLGALLHCALLGALLHCSAINPDMSSWNRELLAAAEKSSSGRGRWWDRTDLSAAASTAAPQHFVHMRGLLAKLDAGLPIVVVALGDSIVKTFGDPWLESFMLTINKTWPHPDHRLINGGRSALVRTFACTFFPPLEERLLIMLIFCCCT